MTSQDMTGETSTQGKTMQLLYKKVIDHKIYKLTASVTQVFNKHNHT